MIIDDYACSRKKVLLVLPSKLCRCEFREIAKKRKLKFVSELHGIPRITIRLVSFPCERAVRFAPERNVQIIVNTIIARVLTRIRDERTLRPHRLLSEQRQRTARLRSDGNPVAVDADQGGHRRSQPRFSGLQPRESHQTVHRIHQLEVSVRGAQVQHVSKLSTSNYQTTTFVLPSPSCIHRMFNSIFFFCFARHANGPG